MTQPLFDVIFRGDILPGQQLVAVKQQLARLFKTDTDKIETLFAGGVVPLKRNLGRELAERYLEALRQAGAEAQVVPAGSVQSRTRGAKRPPPRGRSTLQERLAAQAAREAGAGQQTPPAAPASASSAAERKLETGWQVLPSGSDLLAPGERRDVGAVEVDTSAISLRPQEGNLVDDDERPIVVPVALGELNFDLAEVGEDLLRDEDRLLPAAAPVQVPEVGLAPPGSDLGQIPRPQAPPPPDTSALAVVDPESE